MLPKTNSMSVTDKVELRTNTDVIEVHQPAQFLRDTVS